MISREEVENLAQLARLELSEGEIANLQKDISNILEYVDAVSTAKIPSVTRDEGKPAVRNIMRSDMPRQSNDVLADKEESLRAAFPKREGSFNVVRKIIQKDE